MSANGFIRSIAGIWIVWFLSGSLLYPDAPIKECERPSPSMYCGKGGVPHNEAEYQRFQIWETGLIVGLVSLIPLGLWQRRLAARGNRAASADLKRFNVLGFRALWAVRWLSGTVFTAQVVGGVIGIFLFSYPDAFNKFWLGGALSTSPGFLFGFLLQYNYGPDKLSEHKITVGLLGLIAMLMLWTAVGDWQSGIYAG